MNVSQSSVILNRTVKHSEMNHLRIFSFNDEKIKDTIKTTKREMNKKHNLLSDDKEKSSRTVKFQNNTFVKNKFNCYSKDKFNFMKELEMDSLHKSNIQDSKSSLDKTPIIKVYEELAEMKHQYSKQQNEMKNLKESLRSLKNNIYMKVQEINMLNIKHNDLVDKYYIDSEQNKLLKKENYLLKDTIFKQQYIFKSTMSTLIDIIDSLVFKDFSEPNSVKLKNNVFENSAEALKAYNTEVQKTAILNEIKTLLINKITYVKNALNLNLDLDIAKIESFKLYPPINTLNTTFKFSFYNDEISSSPKFNNEKICFENEYMTTFNENPNETLKEALETNVNSNDKDKTQDISGKKLDLNDKITDFNYDILEGIIIYQ